MTPLEPVRVLQVYSAEKNAEFAGMSPAAQASAAAEGEPPTP